jgi:large subunit ribosomal protein L4
MPISKKSEVKDKKAKKPTGAPIKKTTAKAKAETLEKTVQTPKAPAKLTAEVLDMAGKVIEKISLPEEIFAAKINKPLIAQAVRVYLANQRQGTASTKTRGEVEGSTRKIYRQKGTGRARHGGVRAPIFVHGGIVGGPKPRDYSLRLPQKMKRAALFSVLTAKFKDGEMKILDGLQKIEPKTKRFIGILDSVGINSKKKKILLITAAENDNIKRASRNIEGISLTRANILNTYDILNNRQLIFMKEAIEELKTHFLEKSKSKT